jgi:[ribosomal protein S5]-alanine N-acetyltransferase
MKSPILKGVRLTLGPVNVKYASYFVKCFKDPEVVRYLLPALYKISLKEEKKYLQNALKSKTEYIYLIWDENKNLIGCTGVHLDSAQSKVAGFGIVISDKKSWGKGYAGECIKLLGDFVFKRLKYNRWRLTVFVENKRAIKAYKKVGFKVEGRIRQAVLSRIDKRFHDEYVMSVLREEWLKKK